MFSPLIFQFSGARGDAGTQTGKSAGVLLTANKMFALPKASLGEHEGMALRGDCHYCYRPHPQDSR
jgi:hypothetical protein